MEGGQRRRSREDQGGGRRETACFARPRAAAEYSAAAARPGGSGDTLGCCRPGEPRPLQTGCCRGLREVGRRRGAPPRPPAARAPTRRPRRPRGPARRPQRSQWPLPAGRPLPAAPRSVRWRPLCCAPAGPGLATRAAAGPGGRESSSSWGKADPTNCRLLFSPPYQGLTYPKPNRQETKAH